MNAALLSSKNMCWCTPQDFFDKLNEEFSFTLDAAATDKTAKCPLYFTPETDGLKSSWKVAGGGTPLYCLSQRERIRPTFTITYTEKRKSVSFAGGFASRTTKGTPEIPRPSLLWLLSITGRR